VRTYRRDLFVEQVRGARRSTRHPQQFGCGTGRVELRLDVRRVDRNLRTVRKLGRSSVVNSKLWFYPKKLRRSRRAKPKDVGIDRKHGRRSSGCWNRRSAARGRRRYGKTLVQTSDACFDQTTDSLRTTRMSCMIYPVVWREAIASPGDLPRSKELEVEYTSK
jgi:hypothetical protein